MTWHDYIAFALIAAAAVVVAQRAYYAICGQAKSGCNSGCGSCRSNSSAPKVEGLIPIGPPPMPPPS